MIKLRGILVWFGLNLSLFYSFHVLFELLHLGLSSFLIVIPLGLCQLWDIGFLDSCVTAHLVEFIMLAPKELVKFFGMEVIQIYFENFAGREHRWISIASIVNNTKSHESSFLTSSSCWNPLLAELKVSITCMCLLGHSRDHTRHRLRFKIYTFIPASFTWHCILTCVIVSFFACKCHSFLNVYLTQWHKEMRSRNILMLKMFLTHVFYR